MRVVTVWLVAKKVSDEKVKPLLSRRTDATSPGREVGQSDSGAGSHAGTILTAWQGGHMGSQSGTRCLLNPG